jgi:replicative DNA helicase Mcm
MSEITEQPVNPYDALAEKYKHLFAQDSLEPFPMFGFECNKGWYNILKMLIEHIDTYLNHKYKGVPEGFKITQIKEKFGCYDKETQVLTKNGWKFFKDVTYSDKFATLENNEIKYYHPTDIISYPYKGKMYELNSRGVNLKVTPNHNLYVAKGNYYNGKYSPPLKRKYDFEFTTPQTYFGKKKRFLKSGKWCGENLDKIKIADFAYESNIGDIKRNYTLKGKEFSITSFLKFLGFYVAEGCCNPKTGEISIAFCNVDRGIELDIINTLIKDLKYELHYSMLDRSAGVCKIYDKTLAIWLYENCGHLAPNKRTPDFIKDLTPQLIKHFLDYLYIGDGHETPTANILTTTSKKLSEDVEELLIKAGYSFYTYEIEPKSSDLIVGKHHTYNVNWLLKSNDFNIETSTPKKSKSFIERWTDYDDYVYCVTVPNNLLFVKRRGKGVWCGNSLRFYVDGADDVVHELIRMTETLAENTCEYCGSNQNIMNSKGWIVTACEQCTKTHEGLIKMQWVKRKG